MPMTVLFRRAVLAAGLLTVLLAAWFTIPTAEARSFVFARVEIDATVGPDGSLRIVEERTYRFDGSFSWASYRLPLTGASRIREIRIADERGPYAHDGQVAAGQNPAPGRYVVSRDTDAVLIRWGFRAADESRTFVISYVLDDVVTVYSDVAELYWKFIGTGWDRPTEAVQVTVRLPGRVPAEQIRAWGHGPLHGDVRPVAGGAVLSVRGLPASTMVEGRVIFPPNVVPQARQRRAEAALQRILSEEGRWAAAANRARMAARTAQFGLLGLPIMVLGLWGWLYLRHGREPEPGYPQTYYRDLPGAYTPAELGVLWRFGGVKPDDFVATTLDLIRRGYLTVETAPGGWLLRPDTLYTISRTEKQNGLQPFEAGALAMLFGRPDAVGQAVTVSRRGGLPADVKTRVGHRFSSWAKAVKQAAEDEGFFDTTSMTISTGSFVAGFVVLFVGGWAAVALETFVGIGATIVSALVLILGAGALRRRSQRGADDLRQWQGFRRFLLDFSEMPRTELPALALWEHYLVYAVPLGVAERVIQQLGRIYPAEQLARSPGLRMWSSTSGTGRVGSPLGAFAGFTTALAVATSSASSGSGRGGGFSGGGGGGGGGGGSGGSAG